MIKHYIMNTYRILVVLVVMGLSQAAYSQGNEEEQKTKDRIEAYRAQFITEELELTPEEAQQFWPVYNMYRKKVDAIQLERMKKHAGFRDDPRAELDAMSDEEVYQEIESEMKKQQELLNLRKEYFKKFDEVLPIKKVALLYRAEGEFQRRLIRKLGERRGPHRE
jgi:hypothetical protein